MTVRPWADHELGTMRALHGIVFGAKSQQQLERRFSWQFVDNPAARSLPSIHFAAVQEDRMLGSVSSFPARLKLGRRVETILVPCDLLILPEARGQGLAAQLVQAHRATCGALSIGLAYSPENFRLLQKLGFRVPTSPAAAPAARQVGGLGRVAGAPAVRRAGRLRARRALGRCRRRSDRRPSAPCPQSPEETGGVPTCPGIGR